MSNAGDASEIQRATIETQNSRDKQQKSTLNRSKTAREQDIMNQTARVVPVNKLSEGTTNFLTPFNHHSNTKTNATAPNSISVPN